MQVLENDTAVEEEMETSEELKAVFSIIHPNCNSFIVLKATPH